MTARDVWNDDDDDDGRPRTLQDNGDASLSALNWLEIIFDNFMK